jgi:hypothetical protein
MKLHTPTLASLAVTLLLAAATVQGGEMATKEKMNEDKTMTMDKGDTMAKEGMMTKDDSMAKEGMAKEETMGKEGMMKEEMGQPMGGDKMDKKM